MGIFWENFTLDGLLEEPVHLGDQFSAGSAEVAVTTRTIVDAVSLAPWQTWPGLLAHGHGILQACGHSAAQADLHRRGGAERNRVV
jgi:hypothetical protein